MKNLIAAVLLLVCGSVQAAKVPKVEVCHLDQDAGIFLLKSVSGNALDPHLNHGDLLPDVDNGDGEISLDGDCMLVLPHHVLARAYIDVDDDGAGYDAEHDIDIAVLTDSNNDGVVSVGDEIEVDAFPATFTQCGAPYTICPRVGTFVGITHDSVAVVVYDSIGRITIETQEGAEQTWVVHGNEFGWAESWSQYIRSLSSRLTSVIFEDYLFCFSGYDTIVAKAGSPLQPLPAEPGLFKCSDGDDPFVDVEITPAP